LGLERSLRNKLAGWYLGFGENTASGKIFMIGTIPFFIA